MGLIFFRLIITCLLINVIAFTLFGLVEVRSFSNDKSLLAHSHSCNEVQGQFWEAFDSKEKCRNTISNVCLIKNCSRLKTVFLTFLWPFCQFLIWYCKFLISRSLKWGILGTYTIIVPKDIHKKNFENSCPKTHQKVYFSSELQKEIFALYGETFKPIWLKTYWTPQNDLLNLIFVTYS